MNRDRKYEGYGSGIVFALLMALALPLSLSGQADPSGNGFEEAQQGRGFFMVGVQGLSVDDLNEQLLSHGYPAFSTSGVTIGGGGMGLKGALLVGGEGHGILGSDRTTENGAFQTRLRGGYGLLTVGYDLLPDDPMSLYPLVGLGMGSMTVKINERGAPVFDDLLGNPRRGVEMSRTSVLVQLAIGGDYIIEVPQSGPERGGVALGFRLGYLGPLGQRSWRSDIGDVAGGPGLAPSGLFLRFHVGGGSLP